MKLIDWENEKVKKLDIFDVKLIKLSVAAFILMIAVLWPPLASLDWYWYAVIGVLTMIRPMMKIFGK